MTGALGTDGVYVMSWIQSEITESFDEIRRFYGRLWRQMPQQTFHKGHGLPQATSYNELL